MNGYHNPENQRKIFDLISKKPGLHASKIAELLELQITEVNDYLHFLEKKEDIVITEDGGYQRYYIKQSPIKSRDKRTQDMRKEIFDLISHEPGIHLSKIAELLNVSTQLADYHLLHMEKNKKIISIREKGAYHKRYYIEDIDIGAGDKKILAFLRDEIPLKIMLLLLDHRSLQHKEIYEILDVSPSKLSYHLTKLMNKGIVDVISHGSEKGYLLKNKKEIMRILKKFEKHLGRQLAIENFKDTWKDLSLFK